eukprot:15463340-Alexandrium_andersonii.AAC.1
MCASDLPKVAWTRGPSKAGCGQSNCRRLSTRGRARNCGNARADKQVRVRSTDCLHGACACKWCALQLQLRCQVSCTCVALYTPDVEKGPMCGVVL